MVWCHCSVCHLTFTTARNFDRHRMTVKGDQQCVNPSTDSRWFELHPGVYQGAGEYVPQIPTAAILKANQEDE